jgi:hypothetical protein
VSPLNLIVTMLTWTLVFCVAVICLLIVAGVVFYTCKEVIKWFRK